MTKRWWLKDARWYQFWLPQSGPLGGLMAGGLVWLIVGLILS